MSVGRGVPIQREPVPDPEPDSVLEMPTKEIGNDHTTWKDREKPEKVQPS